MLGISRGMKLCALAESGGCGLEHGLRKAWHTLSIKKKVNSGNWKQPDPAQNTLPIRRKRFFNTDVTSCWCTEAVSLFGLQIIGKHFTHQLIEFCFYIVLRRYLIIPYYLFILIFKQYQLIIIIMAYG